MRIGTMSTLFREQCGTDKHIPYTESLGRIHAAGYRVADLNLCMICADKTTLHTDNWQNEAEAIALTAEHLGISLPQCHIPFKLKKVKWKTPEELEYYTKMLYRAIDVASYLGIGWGVIHPDRFRGNPEVDNAARIKGNHIYYDPIIEYACSKNLCLAFENLPGHPEEPAKNYCGSAEDLAELVDSFGDDRIGACWDTGHGNMQYRSGEQGDALRVLGRRLHCTHVHDNRGDSDLHILPFQGTTKWAGLIGALRDIAYPGDLILETMANNYTPDCLKDETARHSFAVMSCLLNL